MTIISSAQIPTTGLLGYWPFNNSATDLSGQGNHGTVYGAVLTTDRFGACNKAYLFDGVDDYIDFGTSAIFKTNNFSISLWYNQTTYTIGSVLIAKSTDSQMGYRMTIDNNYNWFIVSQMGIPGFCPSQASATTSLGVWHHIVCMYNGSTMTTYLDNVQVASTSCSQTINTDNPLRVGSLSHTVYNLFNGKIDDIRFYDHVLSTADIAALYNETCPLTMPVGIDDTICSGNSTVLSATGGTNFYWYDSPTSCVPISIGTTFTTPILTNSDTLWVANNNGTCESSRDMLIITVTTTTPVFLTVPADTCITVAPFALVGGVPSGGTYSGVGVSAGVFDPILAGAGTHEIYYTYSNNGCSGSDTASIMVNQQPAVVANANDTILCKGDTLVLWGSGAGSYLWNLGVVDGVPFVPMSSNTYYVQGTDVNGCLDTTSIHISSYPDAPVVFDLSAVDSLCDYYSAINLNLYVNLAGGSFSGPGVVSSFFLPAAGNLGDNLITYTYVDSNTCVTVKNDIIWVSTCVGIIENNNSNVTASPNPTTGIVKLKWIDEGFNKINVYNTSGQLIISQSLEDNKIDIDLTQFAPGLYQFVLLGEKPATIKIVKN